MKFKKAGSVKLATSPAVKEEEIVVNAENLTEEIALTVNSVEEVSDEMTEEELEELIRKEEEEAQQVAAQSQPAKKEQPAEAPAPKAAPKKKETSAPVVKVIPTPKIPAPSSQEGLSYVKFDSTFDLRVGEQIAVIKDVRRFTNNDGEVTGSRATAYLHGTDEKGTIAITNALAGWRLSEVPAGQVVIVFALDNEGAKGSANYVLSEITEMNMLQLMQPLESTLPKKEYTTEVQVMMNVIDARLDATNEGKSDDQCMNEVTAGFEGFLQHGVLLFV